MSDPTPMPSPVRSSVMQKGWTRWKGDSKPIRPNHWIAKIFETRPFCGHYVVGSLAIGVLLFCVTLGFAIWVQHASGKPFLSAYLTSAPTYSFPALTAWVLFWGAYSAKTLRELPHQLEDGCLGESRDELRRFADRWHERLYSSWRSVVLGAFLLGLVLSGISYPSLWQGWLDPAWSADIESSWKLSILGLYALFGCLLGAAMIVGFGEFVAFTLNVRKLKLRAPIEIARVYLRPVLEYGVEVGIAWSGALAVVGVMFASDFTPFVYAFLSFFGLFGLCLIALPHIVVHRALLHARDDVMRATAIRMPADPEHWVQKLAVDADEGMARLRKLLSELEDSPTWAFSPPQLATLVAEIAVPVSSIVLAAVLH